MTQPDIQMPPDTPGVRALKIAIVVMGVMIVLGLITIIGRMIYLASQGGRQPTATAVSARIAPNARLALPTGAQIRHVTLSGDRLAVHYEGPAGAGIAIIDLVTGTQLSRVELVPEVPR
jgi:hypothetical protein